MIRLPCLLILPQKRLIRRIVRAELHRALHVFQRLNLISRAVVRHAGQVVPARIPPRAGDVLQNGTRRRVPSGENIVDGSANRLGIARLLLRRVDLRLIAAVAAVAESAEEVAEAIAKRDRIRTLPTGSYALNALGLSTQVPMNIVLLTDGSPRVIKVGKRTIKFKKTTPKNLLAKGKISRLVIQALKEIGNGKVTAEEENKIIDLLKKEEEKDLKHDIALAPVWVQKIMMKAVKDGK